MKWMPSIVTEGDYVCGYRVESPTHTRQWWQNSIRGAGSCQISLWHETLPSPYYNQIVNNRLDERYAMLYSDMNREKLSHFDNGKNSTIPKTTTTLNLVSFADHNGIRRRPYYLQESAELLENTMYAYIVRNFFGEEAFWAAYHKRDQLIKQGIEVIETGKASPEAIVREAYR